MKKIKNKRKENKAITLIALVITIVILIILAAVTINLSIGNNGIFNRAKTAKQEYTNAQEFEQDKTAKMVNEIDFLSYRSGSSENISSPFINTDNLIYTSGSISDGNTYLATDDCVLLFSMYNNSNRQGILVYINDVCYYHLFPNSGSIQITQPIYVKKGQTVKFVKDVAWPGLGASYTVYGLY